MSLGAYISHSNIAERAAGLISLSRRKMTAPIDEDEFQAWLAHPCTVALMAKCVRVADASKAYWLKISWNADKGQPLPTHTLHYERGKVAAFESLSKLKYRDLFKENDDDHSRTSGESR
jgi:hypothetical protein